MIKTDLPVSKREDDAFQRYPYANRIATVIKEYEKSDSFVVGVYGKWGEGKTSVLNFIKGELNLDSNIVVINFNPWLFRDEDQLLKTFFSVLANGLNVSIEGKKEKIGKKLLDYADAIGAAGSLVGVSGVKGFLQHLGNKFSTISIEDYKGKINQGLENSGKRVVVVMDDIDRLSNSEVQSIFRLVKLVADFKNTAYLLSFDDELVASALDSLYSKGGYDYLEKIIQLPLPLPRAQLSAVRSYSLSNILNEFKSHSIELEESEMDRFIPAFDQYLLSFISTPRVAVRYANSISFALPLLKGEVNIVDLVFIEGVKVIFPRLYDFIKYNGTFFTKTYNSHSFSRGKEVQTQEEAKKHVEDHLELYPTLIRERLQRYLKVVFPQLTILFDNDAISDYETKDWYAKKRICSARYFDRYFTYVVLEGEVSDVSFDGILDQIKEMDFLNKRDDLVQLISEMDKAEVALKIQLLEDSFTKDQKKYLALNLSLIGDIFPEIDSGGFRIMAPFQQIAYFIQKCVEDQGPENRVLLAVELMKRATPLNFAFEIWRIIHPKSDGGSRPNIFTDSDFRQVSKVLYERCRNELSLDQLYESIEDPHFRYLLEIGSQVNPIGIKNEIKDWLQSNDENFIKLLYAFSQTTHSFGGSKKGRNTYKSNFSEAFYNLLKNVVDIDFFYSMSVELFGDQSDFEPTSDRDALTDEQLVGWFQRVHLDKNIGELNQDDISND
ncbi:P-loop NTPase fold protein [Algoriphagus sp. NG3]|uniref:KAP family P-loop NTPase fold protein n=1 Tax=Algoriphagus sp. NG3 TaxID=3097546 RepID=UPI002A80AE38|nr:P-loop NTPase fold protein [Algoriphagus sp. NG3]WPR76257.1 P-loop NTPase fold protein [Algoriphagus sp. NG3]